MTRATLLAAVALALPATAQAQSTLDRFEAVAVEMNRMMNAAFIEDIPALEGNLPAPEWDAPMRTAYTCMFDAFVAEAGEDAVADMVTSMEVELETLTGADLLQGGAAVENPEGITDDQALQIVTDCQLMEVFMTRMAEAGAMDILMQNQ